MVCFQPLFGIIAALLGITASYEVGGEVELFQRYPIDKPVIYRMRPVRTMAEPTGFQGYEMPERWHRINNALFDYCVGLGTCSDWRYMGYGHLYYFGKASSAPASVTLTVANMTDPVPALPCTEGPGTEPANTASQLTGILNLFCTPRGTCHQWWYHGCGVFAVRTQNKFRSLPFVVTPLQKLLPTPPEPIVDSYEHQQFYFAAAFLFPDKAAVRPPLPVMEPLTLRQMHSHPTYDYSMEFLKHVYVRVNGTGVNGTEPLFVIDHSYDSEDPEVLVAIQGAKIVRHNKTQ